MSAQHVFRQDTSASIARLVSGDSDKNEPHLHATLQRIDQLANDDVEMQDSHLVQLTIIVVDTNILLEYLDVLQQFVAESEAQGLPVMIVIPGAVIYELDGQKNRDGLSWFARRASTWLLKKVKERKSVKGQAMDETCKPSKNWKKREPGEEFGTERNNDSLILDCCQYFAYVRQKRTFLCSKDKLLCVEVESIGIPSIFPISNAFCSRIIAHQLFENEIDASKFSRPQPIYRNSSDELIQKVTMTTTDDDGMDIDDVPSPSGSLHPTHALDLLHLQVIEYFTRLLLDLAVRVGGLEVYHSTGDASLSRYAPRYAQKSYVMWNAADCLEYLDTKQRLPKSSPRLDAFLTRPYEAPGSRRGQDWSRRDWEVSLQLLAVIGNTWKDGAILESIPSVEFHVRRVFSMPLRPTGL